MAERGEEKGLPNLTGHLSSAGKIGNVTSDVARIYPVVGKHKAGKSYQSEKRKICMRNLRESKKKSEIHFSSEGEGKCTFRGKRGGRKKEGKSRLFIGECQEDECHSDTR